MPIAYCRGHTPVPTPPKKIPMTLKAAAAWTVARHLHLVSPLKLYSVHFKVRPLLLPLSLAARKTARRRYTRAQESGLYAFVRKAILSARLPPHHHHRRRLHPPPSLPPPRSTHPPHDHLYLRLPPRHHHSASPTLPRVQETTLWVSLRKAFLSPLTSLSTNPQYLNHALPLSPRSATPTLAAKPTLAAQPTLSAQPTISARTTLSVQYNEEEGTSGPVCARRFSLLLQHQPSPAPALSTSPRRKHAGGGPLGHFAKGLPLDPPAPRARFGNLPRYVVDKCEQRVRRIEHRSTVESQYEKIAELVD